NAGCGDLVGDLGVVERPGAIAEDLHEVGMRQRVEEPTACSAGERLEVPPPRALDSDLVDEARLAVDGEPVDEVHGPEEGGPRIRREQCTPLVLTAGPVVDLQPELDRQAAPPRLPGPRDVRLEFLAAAPRLV